MTTNPALTPNLETADGRRIQAVEAGTAYASPDGRLVNVASNMGVLFSDDFGGAAIDTTKWTVLDGGLGANPNLGDGQLTQGAIGSGVTGAITASVAGSALTIALGTTNNAEWWLLSNQAFAGTEDLTVILSRSQPLAANSLFVGLVEVDPVTLVPLLNPNLAADFTNRGGVEYCATTGTRTGAVQALGDSSGAVAAVSSTSFTVASMTTTFETLIEFHAEDLIASTCTVDATGGKTTGAVRVSTQCPNDGRVYKLLIRARNTATPATNTNVVIQRILLVDSQELRVEVASGRGDAVAQKAIAINLAGTTGQQIDAGVDTGAWIGGGGFALSTAGGPAAATTGRFGAFFMDLARRLVVQPFGNPTSYENSGTQALSTTANVAAFAAGGATIRHQIQSWTAVNRDTVAHSFDLKDGTTVIDTIMLPTGMSQSHGFPGGLPGTLNAAVNVAMREATTTTNPEVLVQAFKTTAS